MRYAEFAPPPALAGCVRCVWTLTAGAPPPDASPEPVVPDGCAEIVLNVGDPFARVAPDGAEAAQPLAMVVGQITAPLLLRPTGRTRLLGIRLQPWGGPALLGVDMGELRDRQVEAESVLPALARLRDRLAGLPEERWSYVAFDFLAARLRRHDGVPLARAAVLTIAARRGRDPVEAVAADLGVTRRTVERVMRDHVGMSPGDFRRIVRVQNAIRRLRADPDPVLGRIGLEAGYFDHAHFCREFRRLTSVSPSEFLARGRALTEAFLEGAAEA